MLAAISFGCGDRVQIPRGGHRSFGRAGCACARLLCAFRNFGGCLSHRLGGRRETFHHAGYRTAEFLDMLIHSFLSSVLGGAFLLLCRRESVVLDRLPAKHLDCAGHLTDLVGVVAAWDVGSRVAGREFGHGGRHSVDRATDGARDQERENDAHNGGRSRQAELFRQGPGGRVVGLLADDVIARHESLQSLAGDALHILQVGADLPGIDRFPFDQRGRSLLDGFDVTRQGGHDRRNHGSDRGRSGPIQRGQCLAGSFRGFFEDRYQGGIMRHQQAQTAALQDQHSVAKICGADAIICVSALPCGTHKVVHRSDQRVARGEEFITLRRTRCEQRSETFLRGLQGAELCGNLIEHGAPLCR
jgi:hypothetical protein